MPAGLIIAYSHSFSLGGLSDDAVRILRSMKSQFGITPEVEHYHCVVDALARNGKLNEAEELVNSMEKPDIITWTILMGTSRQFNNFARRMSDI